MACMKFVGGLLAGLLCAAPAQAQAQAQGVAEFYKGRNLSLIIPNAPGGSFDLYARLVADNIGRFLGIRWTDGTTSLLTWLGPGVAPFDQAWIADYRRAVQRSGTVQSFPYEEMKQILVRLDATPHPWRAFRLPWQRD